MRQAHRAGEKLFLDFSGDGVDVVDPKTGECTKAKLFVAVLGASNLTYAEPVLQRGLADVGGLPRQSLEYFGGVRGGVGARQPEERGDEARTGTSRTSTPPTRSWRGTTARRWCRRGVRKPRDKAKVEQGVLLAERWILAALRHRTFFSLEELRQAVKPLVDEAERAADEEAEEVAPQALRGAGAAALRPLPDSALRVRRVGAGLGCTSTTTSSSTGHFYSVPYQLVGKQVDLRATASVVELFLGGRRISSHARSCREGTAHHPARAHAQGPPGPGGVDTHSSHRVGQEDGPCHRRAGGGDHAAACPRPAWLPRLPRDAAPEPQVRAARGLKPRARGRAAAARAATRAWPPS